MAYIITALLTALGENRLMPPPDSACTVINARSGYTRENHSWILGRILRDFEFWMDGASPAIRRRLDAIIEARWGRLRAEAEPGTALAVPRPRKAGLCVSVFEAGQARPNHPGYDRLYYSGIAVAVVQVGIAVIPLVVGGDWAVVLVTGTGIVLAVATAGMRQWGVEKWACRGGCVKSVILTKGNGAQHALLVLGTGMGLDLEDLASGLVEMDSASRSWATQLMLMLLAVLWIVLLIIAAGTRQNTWFLLTVGGIGIAENIFVAGGRRRPEAFGVPLRFREVIGETKVMETLFAVERAYPRAGQAMLETFFPGKLAPKEVERWEELRQLADVLDRSREVARV